MPKTFILTENNGYIKIDRIERVTHKDEHRCYVHWKEGNKGEDTDSYTDIVQCNFHKLVEAIERSSYLVTPASSGYYRLQILAGWDSDGKHSTNENKLIYKNFKLIREPIVGWRHGDLDTCTPIYNDLITLPIVLDDMDASNDINKHETWILYPDGTINSAGSARYEGITLWEYLVKQVDEYLADRTKPSLA